VTRRDATRRDLSALRRQRLDRGDDARVPAAAWQSAMLGPEMLKGRSPAWPTPRAGATSTGAMSSRAGSLARG
jgi:hypothetical protein